MKIVVDHQIPLVQEAFSAYGELVVCDGRRINHGNLTDADALIVRSVTRVNAELLDQCPVKFVGSATSGVDHIDLEYLDSRKIAFSSAHGSNAQSVVEYVLSSLFVLAQQNAINLFDKSVGIIGCGKVGSRLQSVLHALAIECIVNDPPLQDKTGDNRFADLEEILSTDIITLHVPLTGDGNYPTRYLVNREFLKNIRSNAILINTSRGGVIDEKILQEHMDNNDRFNVVLDVWEHEPDINLELLTKVIIGTPHIAGYSMDAKIRATNMLYSEFCRHFELQPTWQPDKRYMKLGQLQIRIDSGMADQDVIQLAVLSHFDVRSDAAGLRRSLEINQGKAGYYFDELRKNYPVRREFSATTVQLSSTRRNLAMTLQQLGFNTITTNK